MIYQKLIPYTLVFVAGLCCAACCNTSSLPLDSEAPESEAPESKAPNPKAPNPKAPKSEVSEGALVLTNAAIYTLNTKQPWAKALAIDKDGNILAVGSEASVLSAVGDDAQIQDLGGRMVLPGFHDPHLHVPEAGLNLQLCFLEPGETQRVYARRIQECADAQPGNGWVRAAGASIADMDDPDLLPIEALDKAIPDRPVLILDDLGHSVWTNTLGLQRAGIGLDDSDPPGRFFDRDPDSEVLTGLLFENAQHRVRDAASFGNKTVYEGLQIALKELAKAGVTSVSDAGGYWTRKHPRAWQRALDEDILSVRAHNSLYLFPDKPFEDQMRKLTKRFSRDSEGLLSFDTIKIYVDGIFDLGTAAMVEPYDRPLDPLAPRGFFYFDSHMLKRYAIALHKAGFQLHFHAVGDGAVREALDTVEAISRVDPKVAERFHRISHTYLVHPDDVERFAELGVVADFQMAPGSIDAEYINVMTPYLGARAQRLVPVKDLLDAGAHVTLSSDWDADPLSPLGAIERGLLRKRQAIPDLATAIRLLTLESARLFRHADRVGSLEVGKAADLVVLSDNLFEIKPNSIGEVDVVMTMLQGDVVYQAKGFRP